MENFSSLEIEDIRNRVLNFTIGEICEFLGISKSSYGKHKKFGKLEVYRKTVMKMLTQPEVIIKAIEKEGGILESWIDQPLYMRIRDSLEEKHLENFFNIFCNSVNDTAKIQSAIFIGRVGTNQKLNNKATRMLLQIQEIKSSDNVHWGIYTGLVLVGYEQIYSEFLNKILETDKDTQENLLKNFYSRKILLLKSSVTMLNAHEHAQGYTFYSVILLHLFRHEIKSINSEPDNLANYIPALKQGLIDLKKKPIYLNKSNYQKILSKIIKEIEDELFC